MTIPLAKIATITVCLPITVSCNIVAELKHGKHPCLFLIVLNHGSHRLIFSNHCANPATKAAVAAAGRGGINHKGTLTVSRGTAIHSQQILVGVPPRIWNLHKILPNIVVQPILDRCEYIGVRKRTIWAEMCSVTLLLIPFQNSFADSTFCFTRAKDHDCFAFCIEYTLDKAIGGVNLHSVGTPTKVTARIGISASYQIDPKCVCRCRSQSMRNNGKSLFFCRLLHLFKRFGCPNCHHRRLNQSICTDNMYGFFELLSWQLLECIPNKLNNGSRIFTTTVTTNPRNHIFKIQFLNYLYH